MIDFKGKPNLILELFVELLGKVSFKLKKKIS